MSQKTFKMGDATIFQDKPSDETRRILSLIDKKEDEKADGIAGSEIEKLTDLLAAESEADLSVVLKSIVRKTKLKKQKLKSNTIN